MAIRTVILGVALVVIILALLPRRRRFAAACESLVGEMKPHQLQGLIRFVESDTSWKEATEFWESSRRLAGLWDRWTNLGVLLRLCQVFYSHQLITREDFLTVLNMSAMCGLFTFIALPEAALCAVWSSVPHFSAHAALNCYSRVAIRTFVLCADKKDAPVCVANLAAIL